MAFWLPSSLETVSAEHVTLVQENVAEFARCESLKWDKYNYRNKEEKKKHN